MWEPYKKGYKAWLQLEKSLSENSVEAYLHDIEMLTGYLSMHQTQKAPSDIELKDLESFIHYINGLGLSVASQARLISGLRSFFKYCLLEDISKTDPSLL